jgi:hypothetical protein
MNLWKRDVGWLKMKFEKVGEDWTQTSKEL